MQGIKYRYSALYKDMTESPELTRFRRYTEYWTWMLYNESAEIHQLEQQCNAAIKEIQGFPSGVTVFTVTDLHLAHMQEEHPSLSVKLETLKKKLRRYGKDLCLARDIVNLPDQTRVFAEQFASYANLFEDGSFGLTGEDEEYYKQVPPHPDTCTLKDMDGQDFFSELFINNIKALRIRVDGVTSKWGRKRKDSDPETPAVQQSIGLDIIRTTMSILTCLYAPLLFTASMAILSCIHSIKIRIVVAGVLGTVFSTSIHLMAENVKRSDVFSITAAYFAVLGVFIGAGGGNSNGR